MGKRHTNFIVDADIQMWFHSGQTTDFTIRNIECVCDWDECSRESAEFQSVFDYVGKNFYFESFSIQAFSSSPVKEKACYTPSSPL